MMIHTVFTLTCDGSWGRRPGLSPLSCPTELHAPYVRFIEERAELTTVADMRANAVENEGWECGFDGDFCPQHVKERSRPLYEASAEVLMSLQNLHRVRVWS